MITHTTAALVAAHEQQSRAWTHPTDPDRLAATLRRHGFEVVWPEDPDQKIALQNINWQKRFDPADPPLRPAHPDPARGGLAR